MSDDKRVIRGPQDSDERILVPSERVISRNSGCWNCVFARDGAAFWRDRREADLRKALVIATDSALGENHPKVINIRRMVDFVDRAVRTKALLRCAGNGMNGNNEPVGDLVANSFMCRKWVGAVGASIAREGGRINDLPEEIREKIDGPDSSIKSRLEEIVDEAKKGSAE